MGREGRGSRKIEIPQVYHVSIVGLLVPYSVPLHLYDSFAESNFVFPLSTKEK